MACATVRVLLALLFSVICMSCATRYQPDAKLEAQIAQKLLLDIRYFCQPPRALIPCTEPVTALPAALNALLGDIGLGGVILFAENLQDSKQILSLNLTLQQAAKTGGHPPLFIAIDQEGGRVVRIPQKLATSFSGNMAIGATYAQNGLKFASLSGAVIGQELAALGFNLNFAPSVDVNVNPHNPVINVRSFGEDPQVVAELGLAQMLGIQQQGVIAALKHFPGHGDTSVDSHTGLPKVEHDAQTIRAVDLKPFQYAIDHGEPGMIMTAHIQYPALDNRQFSTKDGSKTILPATMSRTILVDLLRQDMGFKGVIITDALDMAGIAQFYQPAEAVIQTFRAGSDIALMPITIRSPGDIPALKVLIRRVAKAVQSGRLDRDEIMQSAQRILRLKQQYALGQNQPKDIELAIRQANAILGSPAHRQVEQALATSAIVALKNQHVWPIAAEVSIIHLVMPDTRKCMAMIYAIKTVLPRLTLSCTSLAAKYSSQAKTKIAHADLVLFGDITPQQSLAERGGMDDIRHWQNRADPVSQADSLLGLMQFAKLQDKQTLFISLRSPYNVPIYAPYADGILATLAYNVYQTQYMDDYGRLITQFQGPIFSALAAILAGHDQAAGSLPVSIDKLEEDLWPSTILFD